MFQDDRLLHCAHTISPVTISPDICCIGDDHGRKCTRITFNVYSCWNLRSGRLSQAEVHQEPQCCSEGPCTVFKELRSAWLEPAAALHGLLLVQRSLHAGKRVAQAIIGCTLCIVFNQYPQCCTIRRATPQSVACNKQNHLRPGLQRYKTP